MQQCNAIDSEGIGMILLVSITSLKSVSESISRPNPAIKGALLSDSFKGSSIFILALSSKIQRCITVTRNLILC